MINAPKKKVWHAMLDDKPYREWTAAFNPGSHFDGDWNKGSKIFFLGPDPKIEELGGMVSRIAENKQYEFIICPQNTSMLCIEDECGMQIINPAVVLYAAYVVE